MSRESLARVYTPEPEDISVREAANDNEERGVSPVIHPEVANDNESGQPISTIYPETTGNDVVEKTLAEVHPTEEVPLPVAANDDERIAEIKEKLAVFAQNEAETPDEGLEVPLVRPESIQSTSMAEAASGHSEDTKSDTSPQPVQAAGGARKKDDTSGGTGKTTGGSPIKGGILAKTFSKLWGGVKFLFKGALFVLGAAMYAALTTVIKTTNGAFKGMGWKDDGKGGGGGAAKKPAANSGGGGGGHH